MADRTDSSQMTGALSRALVEAVVRICEAEGVALAQVRSIEVDDDEISVRIERPGGGGRIVTYPVAVLLADATKSLVC